MWRDRAKCLSVHQLLDQLNLMLQTYVKVLLVKKNIHGGRHPRNRSEVVQKIKVPQGMYNIATGIDFKNLHSVLRMSTLNLSLPTWIR